MLIDEDGEHVRKTSGARRPGVLTKADLIEEVARMLPRQEATTVVELILASVVRALDRCDKVEIRGFGSFRTRPRGARIGRNPKTGALVEVPAKRIPFFKPSKKLPELVDGAPQATK